MAAKKRQFAVAALVVIAVGWLLYVIVVAYATLWCVTRIMFAAKSDDRVVTAATLYRLIEGNTVADNNDSTSLSAGTYYHVTYDFDEDRIKLLRVTKLTISIAASYDRPRTTKHARFVKSWRDLKQICDSSKEWPPPLDALIDVVDREVLANVTRTDVTSKKKGSSREQSLTVSVISSRSQPTVLVYRYDDDRDNDELRLTLPTFLDADVVSNDSETIKIRLRVKSPCSHPDVVTYEDFRRYYVTRRTIASPPPLDAAKRDATIPQFRWRCTSDDDLDPTLVPAKRESGGYF